MTSVNELNAVIRERERCYNAIITMLMREEEKLWSEQKRGEYEYAPGISRAIRLIKNHQRQP